ncbi:MAG: tetratricopeptide repeat protein, partial [Terracidiphilus sp.]
VEGSVMRSGNRVRITAQLLHGPTDQHLWAHSYDRDVGDVLRLQSEVAETVAQQVRAKLSQQQQSVLHSAPAVDPDAYDAFLRGRYLIDSGELNAAKGYFEQSIRRDPNYALAYVGLAESYIDLAFFRKMTAEVAYRPAEAAILKAIELDNSIGEAHDVLALMRWRFDWDWKGAEEEFESAIALAPNYDCAHSDRSNYLALMGRKTEALAEVTRSRELSPGTNFDSTESADLYLLRDYSSLVAASKKGTAIDPKDWLEHFYLGAGYEGSGDPQAAIPEYRRAVELSGGDEDPTASLAHAYAITGRRAESTRILRELERKSKTEYVSSYLLATIYAGLGDKERAFSLLEKAYEERSLDLGWAFKSDLRLDNLRSDTRYRSLVRRMAFPNEAHSGT